MAMTAEAKAPEAALQEFGGRLAQMLEQIGTSNSRLRRVCDRAFGSVKTDAVSTTVPKPVPSGEIEVVRDRLIELEHLVSEQYNLINRIDQIV